MFLYHKAINQVIKKGKTVINRSEMKTKTGRLLMMQMKAKSNQSVPVDRQNIENVSTDHYTPAKPQISSESLHQTNTQYDSHQLNSFQNKHYQTELALLTNQNNHLHAEIQKLKKSLYFATPKPSTLSSSTQTPALTDEQPNQVQSNKNKHMITSEQKPKSNFKLKQKCSALQVQNYRLIESNYLLLLNLKKNLRLYKESLTKILSRLEALQFPEASKDIYEILSGLKNQELTSDDFQKQLFPFKKDEPIVQQQKAPIESIKPLKFTTLSVDSSVYNCSHIPEGKIEQKQNDIQINLKKLQKIQVPAEIPYTSRQSSSFHVINSRHPDPDFTLHSNNKLFNSQIRDHDFQVYGLDKVSLQDKIQSDWDHSAKKQPTIYKCHGSTTELYKMLMLQAMTIQAFI